MSGSPQIDFFHMSPRLYVVGDNITGNGRDKVDARIENELEKRRSRDVLLQRGAICCFERADLTF